MLTRLINRQSYYCCPPSEMMVQLALLRSLKECSLVGLAHTNLEARDGMKSWSTPAKQLSRSFLPGAFVFIGLLSVNQTTRSLYL